MLLLLWIGSPDSPEVSIPKSPIPVNYNRRYFCESLAEIPDPAEPNSFRDFNRPKIHQPFRIIERRPFIPKQATTQPDTLVGLGCAANESNGLLYPRR